MMKRRGLVIIKASEWESLNDDIMDLRERAEKNAKLTHVWAEYVRKYYRECKDAQAYIKKLEADLERVRAELVEYKRMYVNEVEKRLSFAVLLKEE